MLTEQEPDVLAEQEAEESRTRQLAGKRALTRDPTGDADRQRAAQPTA